ATREEVQPVLDLNFHISLGGPVTFKNAHEVKEVAKLIPLDRLLIETDAPFLARHPNRGKRKDRKSTRLNSSHVSISYAVFCLKILRCTPCSTLFPYTTLFRSCNT